jgi:Kef-type K+ transport system membrane component KefB
MQFKDKIIAALGYLFGIPALYIVLTKNKRGRKHGTQAFILWIFFFIIFFTIRFLINTLWGVAYDSQLDKIELFVVIAMGLYAFFCAIRCLLGKNFTIPF